MAYFTVLRRPNDEGYTARRVIDESSGDPVVKQNVTNTQQMIVTVMCGTHADVVRAKRYVQDSDYCHEVNDGTTVIQDGLNLFHGTISGLRYLPIGRRDDGDYLPGVEI